MSKIGKKLIIIPAEVEVKKTVDNLEFSSKDGKKHIKVEILPYIEAKLEGDKLTFTITDEKSIQARSNWGTIRALSQNAIDGIVKGFSKILDIQGVGFRATVEGGKTLVLNIGFSHPVKMAIPEGITMSVDKNNSVTISGINKAAVGEIAAKIRALKKPNPYLGTGIKYRDEIIKKKAGKKAAAASVGGAG
ncbi:MAG: 50S ribosomal protein L6 [Candidatus Pacebacteria bacterium]|nr:50S ribosomal protein L6 [Candidatus Paceibacterota bacterium]